MKLTRIAPPWLPWKDAQARHPVCTISLKTRQSSGSPPMASTRHWQSILEVNIFHGILGWTWLHLLRRRQTSLFHQDHRPKVTNDRWPMYPGTKIAIRDSQSTHFNLFHSPLDVARHHELSRITLGATPFTAVLLKASLASGVSFTSFLISVCCT